MQKSPSVHLFTSVWHLSSYVADKSLSEVDSRTAEHLRDVEAIVPTWAATKSLVISKRDSDRPCQTKSEVIAPLLRKPPTCFGTLYTALMMSQGISADVVGPHRKTIITLDLDLYYRAINIQESTNNRNWVLCAGTLHIIFAVQHALGKTVDQSGLDT